MTDGKKSLPEDFDLLAEFNSGDGGAFTRIVEKHSGRLVNFLYRYTLDRGEAEDLAQEAFLRLYKAASGLTPGAKLSTILFKFAYNLAVDHARRKKSRGAPAGEGNLDRAPEPADPAGAPDKAYEASLREKEISAALAELPDTQRLALLLKVYEDRSYAEIAEIMEVSVPSVESLLFRARQSLAKKLK